MELDCLLAPNNAFADTAFRYGRPEASRRNAFARPPKDPSRFPTKQQYRWNMEGRMSLFGHKQRRLL